jgi:hypothetical protein
MRYAGDDMTGFIESIAIKGFWAGLSAAWNARFSPIKITYPRPQELLSGAETLGSQSVSYPIRGTLKRLPKGHEIWLLTQKDNTGHLWPQGFFPVQYNDEVGAWVGRVNGSGGPLMRIVAVVAPPTSQDFFRYFQELGRLRNDKYEPLKRLPRRSGILTRYRPLFRSDDVMLMLRLPEAFLSTPRSPACSG